MKQKKIWILSVSILVIIVSVVLGYLFYQNSQKNDLFITFTENNIIEYGDTSITSKKLVKSADGEMSVYPKINVMKTGKQTLIYEIKNGSAQKKVKYIIQVKDTKKPTIKLDKKVVEIAVGDTYDIASNIIRVNDPVDGDIACQTKLVANSYTVESKIDNQSEGEYNVTITAMDKHQNKSIASFTVKVTQNVDNPAIGNNTPAENPKDIQPTYIHGILLVNKVYGLPRSFGGTDPTAYGQLTKLEAGANAAGYDMPTLSGFRDYDTQVGLYNAYVQQDGQEAADRYSARPGFSEHQSGLCFDIGQIDNDYGSTPAGKWLNDHCADYGFIIRYPNGKESITGYMYEPWHVRYVGVDVAKKIMRQGITLEEYLGVK